jgi:hypothetical protein
MSMLAFHLCAAQASAFRAFEAETTRTSPAGAA